MSTRPRTRQRGATLVVGLIVLVLITLMMVSAFTLSTGNLKAVSNMQLRDEAIAAANVAIERVISSDAIFFNPEVREISVPPYTVNVREPVCLSAVEIAANTGQVTPPILIEGGPTGGVAGSGFLVTQWELVAEVNDAVTGARAEVRQGIKITLPGDPNPCP